MSTTKYVVGIRHGMSSVVEAVIFSDRLGHDEVGPAVFGSRDNIVSAGFCFLNRETGKMEAYGKSHSLKIESWPETDNYLLDVAVGTRARLDSFDDERPPPGVWDDHAQAHIDARKEKERGC